MPDMIGTAMSGWIVACFAVMLLVAVLIIALTALAFTVVRRMPRTPAANE